MKKKTKMIIILSFTLYSKFMQISMSSTIDVPHQVFCSRQIKIHQRIIICAIIFVLELGQDFQDLYMRLKTAQTYSNYVHRFNIKFNYDFHILIFLFRIHRLEIYSSCDSSLYNEGGSVTIESFIEF